MSFASLSPQEKALSQTKIALMARPDSVFFCELAFSLKCQFSEETQTASTNGKRILFNPNFFMQQTPEARLGLLLHETLHPAYLHLTRRGARDPKLWNIAADHVINLVILERGFKLPEGGYHDERFRGMHTEQVYDILKDEQDNSAEDPSDEPMGGTGLDLEEAGEDCTPQEIAEIEEMVEQAVVRAAIRSQQEGDKPGTVPGDLQFFIDKLLKPKLPWNRILQKYLSEYTKGDYTFRKPNRRFFPDYYLPSLHSEALMDIAVAVDASGSVSDDEFQRFISEIAGIFRMTKPKRISLITFDTAIRQVDEVTSFQALSRIEFTGRGGTDIGEVVDWINQHKPRLTLVFTDGHFDFRDHLTQHDTVWLIHGGIPQFQPPFGKTIRYEVQP